MREDAARAMRAEDYEFLRSRARARLRAVESTADERATAEAWRAEARPSSPPRRARVRDRELSEHAPAVGYGGAELALSEPQVRARRVTPPRAYGTSIGPAPQPYGSPYGGEPGRRTIQITGHVAPRSRQAPAVERFAARPDRTAMWAVMLGLFLVLMAIVTAHS